MGASEARGTPAKFWSSGLIPELGDRNLVSNLDSGQAHERKSLLELKSSFDLEFVVYVFTSFEFTSVRAFSGIVQKRDEPDRCLRLR